MKIKKLLASVIAGVMALSTMNFALAEETGGQIIGQVDVNGSIWGETRGSADESYVVKFYSNDTLIGQTSLTENYNYTGDISVTWSLKTQEPQNSAWTGTWEEGHPRADYPPTKCELYNQCNLQ